MTKAGEIRYCPELGGRETNAAFVWIPPGSFWMGDKHNRTNPAHFVTMAEGFWLQQTHLTQKQYSFNFKVDSNLPQVGVSWTAIADFCRNKPLRIPTEAEWEYAARSNIGHKYLWSGSNISNNVAWTSTNSKGQLQDVAQLKSNQFGIFDITGNAHHMSSDKGYASEELSQQPQLDPVGQGDQSIYIVRGGYYSRGDQVSSIRSRNDRSVYTTHDVLGVRLIWNPM